ncbi:MAG: serine hydrolase [Oscillospiraceae bacterium]|jgi:CubicO group peptidase (beta-lactamase class C family)|nr:serine hydrolase [Oscillospiraceae bacterium]
MKFKKILSLLLVFAAMFSVVTVAAPANFSGAVNVSAAETTTETTMETTTESTAETTTGSTTETTTETTAETTTESTTETTTAPTTSPTATKKTIITVTGGTVNVRSGAGTSYSKVGSAAKGKTYTYLSEAKDSKGCVWYKVQFTSSKTGWITSQYSKKSTVVTTPTVPPPAEAKKTIITVTGGTVNVRSGAGTSYSKVGSAAKGKTYTYLSEAKDSKGRVWYKVQFTSSKTGWITSQYSKKSTASTSSSSNSSSSPQSNVNSVAKKYGAVGIQVAVINDGKVTNTYNYGYATKKTKKMASDTKIRVASISKVAVAINAMKMQEQGIVDINAKIGTYWGATLPKSVTLKSLLSHTSTLKSLGYSSTKAGTLKQLKASGNYRKGTVGSSGMWMYNNYAVGVAGSTLEVAAKKTLTSYAKSNVFNPLGMDAAFSPGAISGTSKLATLYYSSGKVARSVSTSKGKKGSSTPGNNTSAFAGGLTCSAEDLAKMVAMLANDGEYNGVRILTPESVAVIEKMLFTKSANGGSFSQCMPLRYKANLYGESELYYHTGNAYGVLALMSYNPSTGDGVVVVTTGASSKRDSQGVYAVCSEITKYMYKNVI